MFGISGLQLEALAYELCGTLIRKVEENSLVEADGRLRPGDLQGEVSGHLVHDFAPGRLLDCAAPDNLSLILSPRRVEDRGH